MRGPKPAYPLTLTAEEVKRLQQFIQAHTKPQTLAVRIRIILTANAHPEQSDQQIASSVGTTDRTVRTWLGRWVKTRSLADAPRSGAPRRFSSQVRVQVTAIACSLLRQCQVPLSRWSRAQVASSISQDPGLPRISASTVERWLKAERLRLWRYHAWQHIHETIAFLQRARPVLSLFCQSGV